VKKEEGHKYKFSMYGKKYSEGYDRIFKKKKKVVRKKK